MVTRRRDGKQLDKEQLRKSAPFCLDFRTTHWLVLFDEGVKNMLIERERRYRMTRVEFQVSEGALSALRCDPDDFGRQFRMAANADFIPAPEPTDRTVISGQRVSQAIGDGVERSSPRRGAGL